jgi:hypothetical protein
VEIQKEPVKDKESELFGQKVIKVNPSDKAAVEVKVRNKGNLNDTYDLKLEGHEHYLGWNAYFSGSPMKSDKFDGALSLDATIMENQFSSVYKGSEGVVEFVIEAPEGAQEDEILTLKVVTTSQYSTNSNYIENISKFDYIIVEVNPVPDLELKCRHPRQYVDPGGNVTFSVDVINRGNTQIDVELEYTQLDEGWSLEFQNNDGYPFIGTTPVVKVVKEGVTTVKVMLSAPPKAEAGSRQDVVVKGTTLGGSLLVSTDSVALTAIVSQTFDINVSILPAGIKPPDPGEDPPILSVNPGSTITYNINISNEGNGDDFVIITPTLLEVNWDATFYLYNEERVTSELDKNETVTFRMQIVIPKTQLAGTYQTGINVSSLGDREIVYFDTVINKVFNLSAYGVVHSKLTSDKELNSTIEPYPGVSPGSILNFVFEVTNGGNAPDWITVNLAPQEPTVTRQVELGLAEWSEFESNGWEGYFIGITNTEAYMTNVEDLNFAENLDLSHETSQVAYLNDENTSVHDLNLRLGVGQQLWLKFQLRVPRDLEDSKAYFRLECNSADPEGKNKDVDLANNLVQVNLQILKPDLMVGKNIHHPKNIGNGDIVTISGEISNIGDIEAQEVIVTFYVDGSEIRSQTINVLEKGSTRLVPFTWQGESGKHKLTIKVDPEDAIVEKNEKNNENSTTVNSQADGGLAEIFSNREFCSVLPIIIVVIILAIIIIIIKKRGSFFGLKPGGEGGY